MQIIDTFSGIGGFSLAGEWIGWETILFCEIDPFCRKVLKKHWPDVYLHGDIKTLNREIIQEKTNWDATETTIIVGGFPCQPFSHAGKRKGSDDNRYLWPEYYRVIQELRPTYIVGENVAGLVTMENGTLFEKWIFIGMESKNYLRRIYSRHLYRTRQTFVLNEICNDLERENYTVESFIIPACGVGAWHRRDRIWIIAYSELFRGARIRQHDREDLPRRGTEKRNIKENDVPNTTNSRIEEMRKRENQANEQSRNKDVPNTNSQGLPSLRQQKGLQETEGEARPSIERGSLLGKEWIGSWWKPEPDVGGMVDGISPELDGYWDREPEVPRVSTGAKDRVNKLKALGNAVVPQIPYEIFLAIQKIEDEKQT